MTTPGAPFGLGRPARGVTGTFALVWGTLCVLYTLEALRGDGRPFWIEAVWLSMLALPLVAWVANRRTLSRLTPVALACLPFHEGQAGEAVLTLENGNPWGTVATVRWDEAEATLEVPAGGALPVAFHLPAGSLPRGRHPWAPLEITTGHPFQMIVSHQEIQGTGHWWVYPALEPHAPTWPPPPRALPARARHGDEVQGFRGYVAGDPLRTMDWKVSARQNALVVREFEAPTHAEPVFTWTSVQHLGVEPGLRRLAAWVDRAAAAGLAYGLELDGERVPVGSGPAHRTRCLEALACFRTPA